MKSFADTSSSSSIAYYEYDHETLILEVEFKSGVTYRYFDVDEETFERLQEAESVGNFIATEIKKFKFEKMSGVRIPRVRPWRFIKKDDVSNPGRWPFPTSPPPQGVPAAVPIHDEEVFDDILEWSHEDEEAFVRMIADKNGDL